MAIRSDICFKKGLKSLISGILLARKVGTGEMKQVAEKVFLHVLF
jgi:hypothetical protein